MVLVLIGILTKLGGPILHAYLFEERSSDRHAAHDTMARQPSAPSAPPTHNDTLHVQKKAECYEFYPLFTRPLRLLLVRH